MNNKYKVMKFEGGQTTCVASTNIQWVRAVIYAVYAFKYMFDENVRIYGLG